MTLDLDKPLRYKENNTHTANVIAVIDKFAWVSICGCSPVTMSLDTLEKFYENVPEEKEFYFNFHPSTMSFGGSHTSKESALTVSSKTVSSKRASMLKVTLVDKHITKVEIVK